MGLIRNRETGNLTEHLHYLITCGACTGEFESCGIPCFVYCPYCQTRLILWREG